jgi:ATP-dependent DNA helicase
VVDEGHRLKNLNCKLIIELKKYSTANRLLLTGTPLQNNLAELWSLLNFLMPEIFNDLEVFEEWFDSLTQNEEVLDVNSNQKSSIVTSLHQILKPFLLRRVKTEVTLDLPKKREYILYAPMTLKQRELYDAVLRNELPHVIAENLGWHIAKENDHPDEQHTHSRKRKKIDYADPDENDFDIPLEKPSTSETQPALPFHISLRILI